MLANFNCGRTVIMTGLALLIGGEILQPPSPTLAAPSSEQSSPLIPIRRKPGGSRQLVQLPGRRKSGSTRGATYVNLPGRRESGSTRGSYANLPGRRESGSTRGTYAELPNKRKPGGARTDIALLLDQTLLGNAEAYCSSDLREMTALIPENLRGLTASATPTLYFAVPTLSDAPTMEFVLQDDQQQVIYTAKITPQTEGGIMAIKIPSSHALEGNKTYHWYLSAICDANYRERDLVVEGLVQRVQTNGVDSSASSLEQLQAAQKNNLWQDALHTVISLHQQEGTSENLQATWQKLVKSVNLPEFENLLQDKAVFEPNPERLSSSNSMISHVSNQ